MNIKVKLYTPILISDREKIKGIAVSAAMLFYIILFLDKKV